MFTCTDTLARASLADRRLRLWALRRAVDDTDAVLVATEESRAALARWLAVDAPLIESHDAARHQRLYRELVGRTG